MTAKKLKQSNKVKTSSYSKFYRINGWHPLQNEVPTSVVKYQARLRKGGKVAAFNFDLAREIGLIPSNHENSLNADLEKKILETFGIIIINEYDIENNLKFPAKEIKENEYMATRYVQLQHENKQGKTSGDGRSIWNGQFKGKNGITYDISSCGTGATCLSPAAAKYKKNFQSGDPSISYGCGYSQIDEGFCTLFMSEVLHENNVATERVLALLEFENGYSINVRIHDNLLRPSHLYLYLKQNDFEGLEKIVNFYINRQIENGSWKDVPMNSKKRYDYFLEKFSTRFAEVTADFEDEYIFCWLDWDGDNILMDGSIIDYGSVRQFGLYHSEYRYDDTDRYSTNIVEQKNKAKGMVQTMAQLVDFVKTGKRKPRSKFSNHKTLKHFEKVFLERKSYNLLYKTGIDPKVISWVLENHLKEVKNYEKSFRYFEMAKSILGPQEVPDGINWNPIFSMRDLLRELPQFYLSRGESIENEEFLDIMKSSFATEDDLELSAYRKKMIRDFQKSYWKLVDLVSKHKNEETVRTLLSITMRSSLINKFDRITGDSITKIVQEVMEKRPRVKVEELHSFLNELVAYQTLVPSKVDDQNVSKNPSKLLKGALKIVKDYREGL